VKDCFVVFAFTTNSVWVVSFILVEVAVRLCYMIIYFSFVLVPCWLLYLLFHYPFSCRQVNSGSWGSLTSKSNHKNSKRANQMPSSNILVV